MSHESDLRDFAGDVSRHPNEMANVLFPSHPKGYVTATKWLGVIAMDMFYARTARKAGDISKAFKFEARIDSNYNRLPRFAKDYVDGFEGADIPKGPRFAKANPARSNPRGVPAIKPYSVWALRRAEFAGVDKRVYVVGFQNGYVSFRTYFTDISGGMPEESFCRQYKFVPQARAR